MIPDATNPQHWNRYTYVSNRPINLIDPTGHAEWDGDEGGGCDTPVECGLGEPGGGDDNDDEDEEDEVIPACGYHHCPDTVSLADAYETGWENFGQAWKIYWNPNATLGQRFLAGTYMSFWGGAHLAAAAGITYLFRQAIIVIGARLATQNPQATSVMLGRYFDATRNYMTQAGKNHTFFNLGRAYNFLDKIGLAKPMNRQFIFNQISQRKDFYVYGAETVTSNLAMETQLIYASKLYFEYGALAGTVYTNFFQAIP